jgi:glycosyltransferase involved in cell wall biosynthesis
VATVTILIPTFQEEKFIRACLESVRSFEDPGGSLIEVLVLDGMSTDGTRDIVKEFIGMDSRIDLIDNPRRIQSTGLNAGIRRASGDLILRLDGHSQYPSNYLRVALETSLRTNADNVGGVVVAIPRDEGYPAALVQALTTHAFGVGNSGFRTGAREGQTDTVPYGCFRRDLFDRVGLFDERLVRAQDYEMNRRIAAAGGMVWLNPAMRVSYFNQPDLKSFLRKQALSEAPYNAYMWYLAPYSFALRHAVTAVFSLGVLLGLVALWLAPSLGSVFLVSMAVYGVLAVFAATQQAYRYRRPLHVLAAPFAFFLYHFLHGAGVLYGLASIALRRSPVQRVREPWPGAQRFRAWPPPEPLRSTGVAA